MGLTDGFYSLFKGTNKTKGDDNETQQGVVSSSIDELELSMEDDELVQLTEQWEQKWNNSDVKATFEKLGDENEKYWKGEQYSLKVDDRPIVDNAIFESLETFLPQATRRNPEPVVELSSFEPKTPENLQIANSLEKRLAEIADTIKLRLKIKRVARHWSIFLLGVAKVGWSEITNDITVKVLRPKKMILDPDATIDEDGYSGAYIGERRRMQASLLAKIIPNKKDYIKKMVDGKMGTDVQFIEWWTDEYYCWTLKKEVLLKRKNPHWNYDKEETDTKVDDYGEEIEQVTPVKGINHFPVPKIPYIFLSIFNLGKHPVDDTSLITQNLPSQDLINKRLKQIDKNADSQNNGVVISAERTGFTKEQASEAIETLNNGGAILVPQGSAQEAVARISAPQLPSDLFNNLQDMRVRLKDVFGVRGLSSAGIQQDQTVRGKILSKGVDTDRIGGGITEYLEQFADDVYNWMVQLMYVYYQPLQGMQLPKIYISVKEGTLLPKDNVSEANQAIELARGGLIDPISLFEKLEYPNPKEMAKKLFLWNTSPQMLFADDPEVQQLMMMQQAQAQAQMQAQAQSQQAEQQGQQQIQQEQQKGRMQEKAMDNQAKMQQLQAKQQGDQVLARVKTQKV